MIELARASWLPVETHGNTKWFTDYLRFVCGRPVHEDSLIALVARAYAMYYDVDWDFVGEDLYDVEKGISRVTGREREVLDLVADGLSSREIGTHLNISIKTIEAHRARINDKMRADDLPHLIRMVMAYNEEQDQ